MQISGTAALFLICVLGGYSVSGIAKTEPEYSERLAHHAISSSTGSGAPEVSTEELKKILSDQSALVLDTRPHLEWSISHIPGALNVAPKPGVPMAMYTSDVAEIGRLAGGDSTTPLVLYCNGPFCGKSRRVARELIRAGYSNVRRYQLGAPTWRALVGVMVIEPDGVRHVYQRDQTAVWIDVRDVPVFQKGSIPGARNIPRSAVLSGKDVGEVFAAKNDGRLPMLDHNTRIIVFGDSGQQARDVAEALAREAFHNVTYFAGAYEALTESINDRLKRVP